MSRQHHEFDQDWDLSEGLDPQGPSAQDLDRFGSEVDLCPHCGASIYDQAEMCHKCGWYLETVPKSMPLWVPMGIFAVVVALIILMLS